MVVPKVGGESEGIGYPEWDAIGLYTNPLIHTFYSPQATRFERGAFMRAVEIKPKFHGRRIENVKLCERK
jgi:hypothetical protein